MYLAQGAIISLDLGKGHIIDKDTSDDLKEKIQRTILYFFKKEVDKNNLKLIDFTPYNKFFISNGEKHGSINKIIAMAKERKVLISEISKAKLNQMAKTQNNQGVIAIVPPYEYSSVDEILEYAKEKKEDPFIVILDGIEDPHNLGAIIRTAETAGVHGIIIPKRRAALVNSTTCKVSAGAVEHMKVARVNNLTETIKELKENGIWVYGTDLETDVPYYSQDLTGPIAIVIGSEGFGMSRLVKENCDALIKIPMKGKTTSLNASVSCGIIIYEVIRQKKIKEE